MVHMTVSYTHLACVRRCGYERFPDTVDSGRRPHAVRAAGAVSYTHLDVYKRQVVALPPFGEADNPYNNEVSQRYIEKGIEETGAINFVAGMILDLSLIHI